MDTISIVFMVTVAICFVAIFAPMIFLYWFRNKPIVAMGQPRLLFVMCVGSLLRLSGYCFNFVNFRILDETSSVFWYLATWFWHVGDFMVALIIFLKLYRVNKVMQLRRGQTVLPRHVLVPFSVALILPLALCLAETILTSYYGDKMPHRILFFRIHMCIEVLLLLAILVFAWRLRNVTESVGDTRRILRWSVFKLAMNLLKIIAGLPGVILYSFVREAVFIPVPAAPIFLVFPRMYLVWYQQVHNGALPDYVAMYGTGATHVSGYAGATTRTTATSATTTATTTATPAATPVVSKQEQISAGNSNRAHTTETTGAGGEVDKDNNGGGDTDNHNGNNHNHNHDDSENGNVIAKDDANV